jgi:hypothetical protein
MNITTGCRLTQKAGEILYQIEMSFSAFCAADPERCCEMMKRRSTEECFLLERRQIPNE